MLPGSADLPAEALVEGILHGGEPTTGSVDDGASRLSTFLFADIRGCYTTFTQRRGDLAAAELVAKSDRIVRDLVRLFDGTVVELRGDDLNLAARLCARAKGREVLASPEVTHPARPIDGVRHLLGARLSLEGFKDAVRPIRVLSDGVDPAVRMAELLAAATSDCVATENCLGILDPHARTLETDVAAEPGPIAAATGLAAAWTANSVSDSVSRVEIDSRRVHTLSNALSIRRSAPATANALWAQVHRRIVDAAPWVPLVTPSWIDVLSSRTHNYIRSVVLGVLFDQMWVR